MFQRRKRSTPPITDFVSDRTEAQQIENSLTHLHMSLSSGIRERIGHRFSPAQTNTGLVKGMFRHCQFGGSDCLVKE